MSEEIEKFRNFNGNQQIQRQNQNQCSTILNEVFMKIQN